MPANMSYWEQDSFFQDIDFTIIGSGIVGLNAALRLRENHPKARILILERGMLPTGASTRNAGFACFGSLSELLADWDSMGGQEVLDLVRLRWEGLQRLRSLTQEDLQFQPCGGYELFFGKDEDSHAACSDKMDFFNARIGEIIGADHIYTHADCEIPRFGFQGVEHLILNRMEGHIHTGQMMRKLLYLAQKNGITLMNGAEVQGWEEQADAIHLQLTTGYHFSTQHLLVATNGFAHQWLPEYDVHPARNQVLITQAIPNLPLKGTFHFDQGYYYFRNVGDRLLFGGGRNLSPQEEQTDQFGNTDIIQQQLLHLLRTHLLPQRPFQVNMWWSGILGVGQGKRPIVEKISPRVAVAVRMGGMGIAIGSLVGRDGADLLA